MFYRRLYCRNYQSRGSNSSALLDFKFMVLFLGIDLGDFSFRFSIIFFAERTDDPSPIIEFLIFFAHGHFIPPPSPLHPLHHFSRILTNKQQFFKNCLDPPFIPPRPIHLISDKCPPLPFYLYPLLFGNSESSFPFSLEK